MGQNENIIHKMSKHYSGAVSIIQKLNFVKWMWHGSNKTWDRKYLIELLEVRRELKETR